MPGPSRTTIFLLSPARCGGERAELLARSKTSALGQQLATAGAPIGEVFAWLSALYFRGKLAYARRFARAPPGLAGALVMAPGLGLLPPDATISADDLRQMGSIAIEREAFLLPLRRDAELVDRRYGERLQVVLLGSIATGKYVDTLLARFGSRLVFPGSFVGRGDMSRGGLMLRATRSGEELSYVPVRGATRHGPRPPKLPKVTDARTNASRRSKNRSV